MEHPAPLNRSADMVSPLVNTPTTKALFLMFPLSAKQAQPINDGAFMEHIQDYFPEQDTSQPGYIHRGNQDVDNLITRELDTPVLDEIQDHLHFISPRNHARIDPLHKYRIKKMNIAIAEDPGLHLVWYYDTIFIKPIPPFLLNFIMWESFLLPPRTHAMTSTTSATRYPISSLHNQCKSALGFLRTYAFLIRHPSDFDIAKSSGLIAQTICYSAFRSFIVPFLSIPAQAVSPRYMFGQMRLTRLNWAVRLLQPRSVATGGWVANRLYYLELYTQSSDYSRSWLPPLLFSFAAISLILSAMQVMLAGLASATWESFVKTSWGFSITTILFCLFTAVALMSYVPLMLIGQIIYTIRSNRCKTF